MSSKLEARREKLRAMKENALNIDKDKAASTTVDKTSTTKDDS